MSWEEVFKIISAAILSAGGAGAIIWGISKGLATKLADTISEKIRAENQHKLDKMLEQYKVRLDNAAHISQAYYDIETSTYQELCSAFYVMISAVHWLFPAGLDRAPAVGELEKICNERYIEAQKTYNEAVSILGAKAPFIDKEMCESFKNIAKLAARQIYDYAILNPSSMQSQTNPYKIQNEQKAFERTYQIDESWEKLLDKLRDYIAQIRNAMNQKEE